MTKGAGQGREQELLAWGESSGWHSGSGGAHISRWQELDILLYLPYLGY